MAINTSFTTFDQQFSTIDYQQWMTSFCYFKHETPNLMTTNMQSIMENPNYNNHGISFLAADHGGDRINSHVNFENNCLTDKIRSCKKDRHRKINTARGPKDRRMRLSLDVAKKFFRLQDLLGFDKASNTIQWLLMKSQPAIQDLRPQQLNQSRDLVGASNCPSSGSDSCEVLSVNDDQFCKKRFESEVRKITREKARERARKRTSEKRSIKVGCDVVDRVMDGSTNRLGLWVAFGEDHDQVRLITDQPENPSSHFQLKQGIVGENSSIMSSNWNSSFLFNYHHNLGLPHEHLGEFQNLGKPWEGINNVN